MNKTDLIAIRDANPDDKNFIFSTWLRGLRYGNDWFELIDKDIYYKVYHKVLEKLLTSGVEIKVACLKEDHGVILAYSVYKNNTLHWVFSKKSWRGIGLMRDLVPRHIDTISHVTAIGKSIAIKRGWKFNPFDL